MSAHRRVLVTGAGGFVGMNLCPVLEQAGWEVCRVVRGAAEHAPSETVCIQDIGAVEDWSQTLRGVHAVVHLAARVHVLREHDAAPMERFRQQNVIATRRLAEQAAAAGVARFVFISTIGVHGVNTTGRAGFSESDETAPLNEYALSKLEAEQALRGVAERTGLEVVILRPPLVYGPGVKANFLKLLDVVARGWPLPFASIHNHRDFLFVGNLADAIVHCLRDPRAAGETFLVADGEPLSTPELIRWIAASLHRPVRLFPFPPEWLKFIGRMTNTSEMVYRLTGSLEVNIAKIRETLDWQPPYRFSEGIETTADWYLHSR